MQRIFPSYSHFCYVKLAIYALFNSSSRTDKGQE